MSDHIHDFNGWTSEGVDWVGRYHTRTRTVSCRTGDCRIVLTLTFTTDTVTGKRTVTREEHEMKPLPAASQLAPESVNQTT
jgi:hypothetical protein